MKPRLQSLPTPRPLRADVLSEASVNRSASGGMRSGRTVKSLIMALCLLVLAGGTVLAMVNGSLKFGAAEETSLITEAVKRGPLEISLTERGNLESAANVTLSSKVEGTTAIISIVPEGSRVVKGQVLLELDSSKLRTDATQEQILLEQAEAAEKQASENLAIQKTQNESDIAAAELQLDLARLDLKKYELGEYVQETNTVAGEITLAQEELTRSQEKYDFTRRLSKKGYATQSELEADRIAVKTAEIKLEVAREKMRVLKEFTFEREMAEKKSNATEFERELVRVRRKAVAALVQSEADLSSRKLTAEVERTKYARLLAQIEACTVRAPQDGLVVFANTRSSRGSQDVLIEEGAQVRERQALVNLPDISKMQVSARIHESKIDLVRDGLPVRIRVDARPGETFQGIVSSVSSVPLSGNWPNFNLKEYSTTIAIQGELSKVSSLKPGLTAEVEILIDRLPDVLQVPIQGIVQRGDRYFAFVVRGTQVTRREVKVGKTNDVMMEIRSGAEEGERLVLNPRSVLVDELAQLEKEFPAAPDAAYDQPSGAPGGGSPPARGQRPAAESPGSVPSGGPDSVPKRPRGGSDGGRGPGGGDPLAFFQQIDTDGNGKLSEEEAPAFLKPRFAAIDANGDKQIDKDEFQKAAASFRRAGGGTPAESGASVGGTGSGAPDRGGSAPAGGAR